MSKKISFFITVIAIMFFLSCDKTSSKPELEIGFANVTIELTAIEADAPSLRGATVSLVNNNGNIENIYYASLEEEYFIEFSEVPYGKYTIIVNHRRFHEYIFDNFHIRTDDVSYQAHLNKNNAHIINNRDEISAGNRKPISLEFWWDGYDPEWYSLYIYIRPLLGNPYDWEMTINNFQIPLYAAYWNLTDLTGDGYYHHWRIIFQFRHDQNLTFKLRNNNPNINIEEELTITTPERIIIDWPETINEGDTYISWHFRNNYEGPLDIYRFLFAVTVPGQSRVTYNYMLPSTQREFIIPEGFLPNVQGLRVTLQVEVTNYDVSERASIYFWSYGSKTYTIINQSNLREKDNIKGNIYIHIGEENE